MRRTPWVVQDGQGERVEPRCTAQLALSFDHRPRRWSTGFTSARRAAGGTGR
ncbi:hypothetical protein [Streptomyces sp. V3I8]|uniref:hypothetical protein n=1 Tax=Streptomyces sp. V3I8 TaxID=3042279 RepID=UPI0027D7FB4D|nr:hypothetical protein [Streptomyces sp. V3I8]